MNTKKAISVILFVFAALFVIGFGFMLWRDYTLYYPYGSSPFEIYVIVRAAEVLLPAIICLVAGIIIRKRLRANKGCFKIEKEDSFRCWMMASWLPAQS